MSDDDEMVDGAVYDDLMAERDALEARLAEASQLLSEASNFIGWRPADSWVCYWQDRYERFRLPDNGPVTLSPDGTELGRWVQGVPDSGSELRGFRNEHAAEDRQFQAQLADSAAESRILTVDEKGTLRVHSERGGDGRCPEFTGPAGDRCILDWGHEGPHEP